MGYRKTSGDFTCVQQKEKEQEEEREQEEGLKGDEDGKKIGERGVGGGPCTDRGNRRGGPGRGGGREAVEELMELRQKTKTKLDSRDLCISNQSWSDTDGSWTKTFYQIPAGVLLHQ